MRIKHIKILVLYLAIFVFLEYEQASLINKGSFMKVVLAVMLALGMQNAFAGSKFDNTRCPSEIQYQAEVQKVYKDSKYSSVPGWLKAQQTLQANQVIEAELTLTEKKPTSCVYKDVSGHVAVLSTPSFQDPEESQPVSVDQLTVVMKLDKSSYVTFLPVKEYSTSGVKLYSSPYAVKIKTQLYVSQTKRYANFDLGMIAVSVR
jgi:hypothetical protein